MAAPDGIAVSTLTRRADFIAASKAKRVAREGFTLQARNRDAIDAPVGVRVGFTCSKKVGNAVARNRAKRRLRAIARAILPDAGLPGWDYVLVGRPRVTANLPFDRLLTDLTSALLTIHGRQAR